MIARDADASIARRENGRTDQPGDLRVLATYTCDKKVSRGKKFASGQSLYEGGAFMLSLRCASRG